MITALRAREVLIYAAETGQFWWRKSGCRAGRSATSANPYPRIRVDGGLHKAHQVAWMYVYGTPPVGEIDHVNGVKTDNRIANLRDVDRSKNITNGPLRKDNTSGLKGVYYSTSKRRWAARITKDGKNHFLGRFDTCEEAKAAYDRAAAGLHGEFRRPV